MFRRGKLSFLNAKDDRIKVINERIALTEKHFVDICTTFAMCSRKLAKYRDAYDELAKSVKSYADEEEINESLIEGLKSFTTAVTILGDYMDINVQRLEAKIVNELAMFDNVCKTTRESLRNAVATRDKTVLKQRQMMDIKTKFAANTSAADSELAKAKLEVNRTNKEIDEAMSQFEKLKISNLKNVLTNFILISMKYHTKALEALSASYYDITNIDEAGDLIEFQKIMKTQEEPDTMTHSNDLKSPFEKLGKFSKSAKSLNKSDDELNRKKTNSATDDEEDNDDDDDDDDDSDGSDDDDEDEADDDLDEEHSEPTESGSERGRDDEMLEGAVGGIKKSSNVFGIKQSKPRAELKHPFKASTAAAAATHVKPAKPKRKYKSADELGAASGISLSPGIAQSETRGGISRHSDDMVTIVKSKPSHHHSAVGKETLNMERIDCSKTGATGLLFL